jgi:tRNA(Ile2) C34 agmatinyltransferase TiaS
MGQAQRPTCPDCGAFLTLALPRDGTGKRTFRCLDCERADPMKDPRAIGWLEGELGKTHPFETE